MTQSRGTIRVLYLAYWGALEPLGQSLVVPAVKRLAAMGADLTLLTFEKAADLRNEQTRLALKAEFETAGVRWHPLAYHKTPKWPATLYDACIAILAALRLRLHGRFDIVHARTFVAGPMGYVIARIVGAHFVYHNEGFYPDEQVDGGVWREGSFVHRLGKGVEDFLYRNAAGIIVLSERARAAVTSRRANPEAHVPIVVVPSAVDLAAFVPAGSLRDASRQIRLVYLGSVGLRYRLDAAGRFLVVLRQLRPGSTLSVVSRAPRELVRSMLEASGLPVDAWSLQELPHAEVPDELRRHDAGLFFLTEGLSEHGCSPTKIGEYWACGLPVVTTPNVSDTDALVRERSVGVVVSPGSLDSMRAGARELVSLLDDPARATRCREAAEAAYSLEASCHRQMDLYVRLAS